MAPHWFSTCLALCLAACATARLEPRDQGLDAGRTWAAALHRDHPLVGRVWNVRERRFEDEDIMRGALGSADFVLLGALDDNPDQHQLQAEVVAAIARNRHPVLAFDSLDAAGQGVLDAARARHGHDVNAFAIEVAEAQGGATALAAARPVLAAGMDADLPFVAADAPQRTLSDFAARGPDALAPAARRLFLRGLPSESLARRIEAELDAVHCGLVGPDVLHGMMLTQLARRAFVAERLLASPPEEGVVFITGMRGAMLQRGVSAHLAREAASRSLVAVAFVEVQPQRLQPAQYAAQFGPSAAPFHYLVFTPAVRRADPCDELRRPPLPAAPAVVAVLAPMSAASTEPSGRPALPFIGAGEPFR